MCGISGIFAYSDQRREWPCWQKQALLNLLAHRGPDDRGSFSSSGIYLAHNRLAILDPSVNARQPMTSHCGRYVIVLNGELYNFRAIRKILEAEGTVFHTSSDTEVLAEAWTRWGVNCINKFDGMYAFAVFDQRCRVLYLVRDPLGIKPLYYSDVNGELRFASEPLPLVKAFNLRPNLVPEDLDVYFTLSHLPAPRTGVSEIKQLLAGHLLKVHSGGIELKRHWWINYYESAEDSNVHSFETSLREAVTSQLISDVPLGVLLSGGLDSSAVSLLASQAQPGMKSFTMGFDAAAYDETSDAEILGKHLRLTTHFATFKWAGDEIREVLASLPELLADPSCYPVYQLARFARKDITVALSGDGGDELLAGYRTYAASRVLAHLQFLPAIFTAALHYPLRQIPRNSAKPYGWRMVLERFLLAIGEGRYRSHACLRRIFHPYLKERIYTADFRQAVRESDPFGDFVQLVRQVPDSRSDLTRLLHADLMFHLPSILAKVDRMSMAHGLEVRVPLLRPAFVQFCANIPDSLKIRGLIGKRVLREVLASHVPASVVQKQKSGFLPPIDNWFREKKGPMNEVFSEYLPPEKEDDVIDWREVRQIWQEHQNCRIDAGFVLLNLLHFLNWRKIWLG